MDTEASNTTEITPALLRAWRACYPDDRILKLWAGRPSLTPRQVSELPDVPARDVVWVLVRCLTPARAAAFARWCADRADARYAAARYAAADADRAATYAADSAADAAGFAAGVGYDIDSADAERRDQVEELLRVLESEV